MGFLKIVILVFVWLTFVKSQQDEFLYGQFPYGFMWGLATSAYQIEGAWNVDGKGENSWDFWSHQNEGANIQDHKNGDIACDSYHKYLEDVKLLKSMGAHFYRFSLSWSRIVPTGRVEDGINLKGIDYYNRLIDALLSEGIQPFITLYHWDTPLAIQNDGGWLHDGIVKHFADYARVAFNAFGDRVKWWLTINEPHQFCLQNWNYGQVEPFEGPPKKPYTCAHNVVKAHARAWRIYDQDFRSTQKGKMGISLDCMWPEPKNRNDKEHLAAMERSLNFMFGWWAHPLTCGEYPPIMRKLVDAKSEPGASRLPTFNTEWTKIINGTLDFIGLNHYSSKLVTPSDGSNGYWFHGEARIQTENNPAWNTTGIGWVVAPFGLRKLLTWVSRQYSLPIYITENGYGGDKEEKLDDVGRQNYFRAYINEVLKAIKLDGADVRSYTAWSLLDNYEWSIGYNARFGVHYVDFEDDSRTRTPKESAMLLTKIFSDNGFPEPKYVLASSVTTTLPNHATLIICLLLFSSKNRFY